MAKASLVSKLHSAFEAQVIRKMDYMVAMVECPPHLIHCHHECVMAGA